jgi:hypothetical protein
MASAPPGVGGRSLGIRILYMHAVNAAAAAGRLQSSAMRFGMQHERLEGAATITVRRLALAASLFGALVRAAVSCSGGTLFWWSIRVFSLYQGVLLLAAISALWMLEDPPLYPPNDVPLDEALSMAGTLLCLAGLFTPSNRQRIARVARGFASRHLPALPESQWAGRACHASSMP